MNGLIPVHKGHKIGILTNKNCEFFTGGYLRSKDSRFFLGIYVELMRLNNGSN